MHRKKSVAFLPGLREEITTLKSLVKTTPLQSGKPLRGNQANWTSTLFHEGCSNSEPMSCAVLSRSLHQPKMQCSCTTNQITRETLQLQTKDPALNVLFMFRDQKCTFKLQRSFNPQKSTKPQRLKTPNLLSKIYNVRSRKSIKNVTQTLCQP